MLRSSRSRVVLLVLFLLLVAVPSLQAAGPFRNGSSSLPGWEVLTRVWSFLASSAGDNGCEADPNGRCLPRQSATAASDNGCEADPDGRRCLPHPATSAAGDNGCELDPNGRCHN